MCMQLVTGIYAGRYTEQTDGWRILCEQEKTPFRLVTEPDCTVLLCEGETPQWLGDFLSDGGIAVLSGVHPEDLPFQTDYIGVASLDTADFSDFGEGVAQIKSVIQIFNGNGKGTLCLHEKRKIKSGLHPDEYPAVLWQSVGKGGCWYTGIPFSELICALGDTLREVPNGSDFSERITAIDKHLLLRVMRKLLVSAYEKRGLPYTYLNYYPQDYRSVFIFRVDIDGPYGDNLEKISRAAKQAGIRVSFFVNQNLCQPESERLLQIDPFHYIGCHGREHNLYTTEAENDSNIRDCRCWMQQLGLPEQPGFVAPRGMWNFALNRALENNGIQYTSDFGYCIYDLPFFPYDHGKRMAVKQIPVDPFSTERAYIKALEENTEVPETYVRDRFLDTIHSQYSAGMPIILYSHPQFFGKLAETIFPDIEAELKQLNVWHATMEEFNQWWDSRDRAGYVVSWDTQTGLTISGDFPPGVYVRTEEGETGC